MPAPTAKAPVEDKDTVMLSAFTVSTELETGWSATWATAGLFTSAANSSLFELATAPRAGGGGVNAALLSELCPVFFTGTDVACPE